MLMADLHIHSKYSRATSKTCEPEYLDLYSRRKGIQLLGTGDFTHPAWREELQNKLIPAEEGLYVLKEEYRLPDPLTGITQPTRFVVSGEISSIYKKNGRVRKVHNLILLPGLDAAETLSRKLEAIGNIHSDGRPILGLDSRDLLEITLESCPEAIFVPAHIWTPHFSLFGAFSGFDSIEECFEDLTPHIHALETGLSSDPAMNWRLSALDGYTLISNSDAHSPAKLGRETNLLETDLSYPALSRALREGKKGGFAGTIEFFPEEGKYHLDGHRKCNLCLTPEETLKLGGKCPVCGKKITIGVQHRIVELSDRPEGYRPADGTPFESLAPLPEVIAASTGLSSACIKTERQYEALLKEFGCEFSILREVPVEEIRRVAGVCVAEGMQRLREGKVRRIPGYDGEYGVIQLLEDAEIQSLSGQTTFLTAADLVQNKKTEPHAVSSPALKEEAESGEKPVQKTNPLQELNPEQRKAATAPEPAVAVVAGPGTGKTKTLISRILYLIEGQNVKPAEITAVTFTNKAADEIKQRLAVSCGEKKTRAVTVGTFHSICLEFLGALEKPPVLLEENNALELAETVVAQHKLYLSPMEFLREISKKKNGFQPDSALLPMDAFVSYQNLLRENGVMDFDDLLLETLRLWNESIPAKQRKKFTHILVDEFQDINPVQNQLIQAWSEKSKSLFVIGDPDQAIYGFRGSDPLCFSRLEQENPALRKIQLQSNYRSTPEILNCALSVIKGDGSPERRLKPHRPSGASVQLLTAKSPLSEGIFVAKTINRMLGGIDMLDTEGFARPEEFNGKIRSLSEIAVLYRTHRQGKIIEKCLRQEGIPYAVVGREDFLADPAVRGTIAFFRFLLNPQDTFSLRTSLRLLCGSSAAVCDAVLSGFQSAPPEQTLKETAAAFPALPGASVFLNWIIRYSSLLSKKNPVKLMEQWIQDCGLSESESMKQFLNIAVFYDNIDSFLSALVLGKDSDVIRSHGKTYTSDAVTLMTLHGSKGLEFPVVFLCGVNEGVLPLESKNHPSDPAEERRLLYVGMTRAEEALYLLASPQPSPFLSDIPEELVQRSETHASRPAAAKQLSLFDL